MRGFRCGLVFRSDHWRVTPLTPLDPPLKGREGRCGAFACLWRGGVFSDNFRRCGN